MSSGARLCLLFLMMSTAHAQTYPFFPPPGMTWNPTTRTLQIIEPAGALVPQFSAKGDVASAPIFELIDSASPANNQKWWAVASGVLGLYAVDDAGTPGQSGLQLDRSGTNITQAALLAGSKNLGVKSTGDVLLNGGVGLLGQPILSGGAGANAAYGGLNLSNTNATTNTLPNSKLANSSITLNGASVSLGGTRTLNLASADFANQGTTATLLHGSAAGNPSFAAVNLGSEVTSTLPVGNGGTGLTAGTLNGIPFFSATNTLATNTKLTWNNTTNILQLGNNALDATLENGTANKITLGPNDGIHLFATGIDMVVDAGDIFVTGTSNPFFIIQNTFSNATGFNDFQFVNDVGDGINFGNQPSTANHCSYAGNSTAYALTPATGCSLIDSGQQNTNPLPLVLAANGNTVAVFQNNDDLFAVGGSLPVSTTPVQYLHATYIAGVIATTLGSSANAGSVTNVVGGSGANTQANGSPICTNSTGCPATSTKLTGTTGAIGGGALLAGACASGTATVTGIASTMDVHATPAAYPGDGVWWEAYMSASNTATVKVCAAVATTPTSTTYNVRSLQ